MYRPGDTDLRGVGGGGRYVSPGRYKSTLPVDAGDTTILHLPTDLPTGDTTIIHLPTDVRNIARYVTQISGNKNVVEQPMEQIDLNTQVETQVDHVANLSKKAEFRK